MIDKPFSKRRFLSGSAAFAGTTCVGLRRAYATGAKGDGQADDTDALEQLFLDGGTLAVPKAFYRTTRTLRMANGVAVRGEDRRVRIKLMRPPHMPVVPVLMIPGDAKDVVLEDLTIDGNVGPASGDRTAAPTGHTVAGRNDSNWGSAIIVQGSGAILSRLIVENAWDNGISVFRSDAVEIDTIVGRDNGFGSGGGACIDVSGGTNVVVRGCHDRGSATGFIFDIGAGANGILSDTIASASRNLGFYIGAADSQFSNLRSDFSGGMAFWIDAANQRIREASGALTSFSRIEATNLLAYRPAKQAFLIKTGQVQLTNAVANNAGSAGAGIYDAFEIDSNIAIADIDLVNCAAYGTSHKWGLGRAPGSAAVSGQVIGGSWYGSAGGIEPNALLPPDPRSAPRR